MIISIIGQRLAAEPCFPSNRVEAQQEAARIDRIADLLLAEGKVGAAERLSHQAAAMRTEVAI
jgi:hypothetical protein